MKLKVQNKNKWVTLTLEIQRFEYFLPWKFCVSKAIRIYLICYISSYSKSFNFYSDVNVQVLALLFSNLESLVILLVKGIATSVLGYTCLLTANVKFYESRFCFILKMAPFSELNSPDTFFSPFY